MHALDDKLSITANETNLECCVRTVNIVHQIGDLLALLEIPVPGGKQVDVGIQEPGVPVHAVRGWRVPVDGHLHVGQVIFQPGIARVDLKGVPMIPVTSKHRDPQCCMRAWPPVKARDAARSAISSAQKSCSQDLRYTDHTVLSAACMHACMHGRLLMPNMPHALLCSQHRGLAAIT